MQFVIYHCPSPSPSPLAFSSCPSPPRHTVRNRIISTASRGSYRADSARQTSILFSIRLTQEEVAKMSYIDKWSFSRLRADRSDLSVASSSKEDLTQPQISMRLKMILSMNVDKFQRWIMYLNDATYNTCRSRSKLNKNFFSIYPHIFIRISFKNCGPEYESRVAHFRLDHYKDIVQLRFPVISISYDPCVIMYIVI